MTRRRNDPLDILTPLDEQPTKLITDPLNIFAPSDILTPLDDQPEEVKQAPDMVDESLIEAVIETDEKVAGVVIQPRPSRPIDILEASANILISQFPSSTRDFIIEVADIVLKIPRWELIAGSVLAQYTQGTLASPDLDPSWRDPVISESKGMCAYCKKEFVPHKYNQMFCSNECGGKARKDTLAKKLAAEAEQMRRRIIAYIQAMKDAVIEAGGKPTQIVLAPNVYRQIGPALEGKSMVVGLRIKVDEGAPDDRIYIAP